MKFSVRKDLQFGIITLSIILIGVLLWIIGIIATGFLSFVTILFGLACLLSGGLFTWAWFHSYIELTDEYVISHFGPLETRVTLDRIREVRFTKDSFPILSTSSVRMQLWLYPQEVVTIIGVQEEQEFFEAIQQKLPTVIIVDSKSII